MDETSTTAILDAEITGIRFGLASHKEIRTASISECPITHASQLSNPFLGLPLEFGKCEACGAAEPDQCEGHFGYIELPTPIYHSCHIGELKRLLSLLCLKCSKLKSRKFQLSSSSVGDRLLSSCCEEASQITIKEMKTGDGAIYLQLKVPSKGRYREGVWNFLEKYGYRFSDGFTRTLLPAEALGILKNIHPETKRKLAGKGYFPQDGYIMKYVPVPPNCLSVPDVSDGASVMSSDQSSNLLRKILKQVEVIKSSRAGVPNFESHEVEANDLQLAVEHYFQVRGTAKTSHERDTRYGISKESNDSSTKAWLEKMRTLFIRKGSGFSSRSVITGDSYRGVSEIGVPADIAQRVTIEERVNAHNIGYLQGLVDRKLCLTYRDGDSTYSLKEGSKGHTYLRLDQIVHRRIMDGDIVFINRPPTTHKHSLQALSVYVHDDHTVKINPLICGPLSADFDGDCVHLFYPQSLHAKAEVLELFSVDKQLPSSHTGSLNLQLVTDSLLSLKVLVKSTSLKKVQVQQLAMFLASPLPQPAIVKGPSSVPFWTALQILQSTLPASFNSVGERHLISNSEILNLDLNTDVLSSLFGEIVALVFAEKGPKIVLEFFNQIQPMLMEYLSAKGFSVSLEDFSVPETLTQHIHRNIDETSKLLMDMRTVNNELQEIQLDNKLRALRVFVSTSTIKSSALGDLIDSKSESSCSKVVQQIGFLGPQLSAKGKYYTNTLVTEIESCFEDKYPRGADYPTARYGVLKNSFFHGLDPYEDLVHSVASREVMVRSSRGLAEPGTLFKNLMAILRDVVICYDGTVRNVCSNSVIEFDYGIKSKHKNLFQAGEPVGVLAATAMSNPAYKAVLDSSPSSNSSWELMKEILLCKVNFKNDLNDRRVILYLNQCECGRNNCQERAAYMVQNHLKKFSLKDAAVEFMIEYQNNPTTTNHPEAESGLSGHIHLNKELLNKYNVSMQEVLQKSQDTINSFRKKKKVDQIFRCTSLSIQECCPCEGKWSGMPCLAFCLHDSTDCRLEQTSQILADIICPVLLETIIKGDPHICSVNISWVSHDTTAWVRSPDINWKGELALDVVLEKGSVKKSGDAWRILMDTCLPILHLIDYRRSVPYAIKQVQELFGISCAFEQAVQRLSRSVTLVTKGVLKEHLVLLANSMACSGNLIGFTAGGYKALIHSANIQVPFTEATLYTPRKCFERAAEKCHSDSLSSVVASCSWGKSVAVGTGASFELLLKTDEMRIGGGIDVYSFLHMMTSANVDHPRDTDCLGADVDYLSDDKDIALSPEHDSGSTKPTFDDSDRLEAMDNDSGSAWDKGSPKTVGPDRDAGWGGQNQSQNEGTVSSKSNIWSSWGSDKAAVHEKKIATTDLESTGPGKTVAKTGHGASWNKSSGQHWGNTNDLLDSTVSGSWGKKATEMPSSEQPWGNASDSVGKTSSSSWEKKGNAIQITEQPWGTLNEVATISDSDGWGKKVSGTKTEAWGTANEAANISESDGWGKKVSGTKTEAANISESDGWGEKFRGTKTEASTKSESDGWGKRLIETKSGPWGTGNEAANISDSDGWGKKVSETKSDWSQVIGAAERESSQDDGEQSWVKKAHRNLNESEPIPWGNRTGGKRKQDFGSSNRPPKPVDRFTLEEQEILAIIEPIVQNVKRILHNSGYNEGDRLSADDESYLLNEVFKYHPNKAEKMGTGVDHIVINKHSTYQTSRCFYVQRTDGQQEDFSTRKCLMKLITEKFPDIAESFIRKYYPRQADKERDAAASKEMESAAGTPQADRF